MKSLPNLYEAILLKINAFGDMLVPLIGKSAVVYIVAILISILNLALMGLVVSLVHLGLWYLMGDAAKYEYALVTTGGAAIFLIFVFSKK